MLRCAAFFVTAEYIAVHLIPQNLRALPMALFTSPPFFDKFFLGLPSAFEEILN
jgi:hypothetical protein